MKQKKPQFSTGYRNKFIINSGKITYIPVLLDLTGSLLLTMRPPRGLPRVDR